MRHSMILAALPLFAAAGCATVAGAIDDSYTAALSGQQEVPGPGDPDGTGTAEVTVVDAIDNVCYKLNVSNIAAPTAAHIHRGAAGTSGPPVVTLATPTGGSSDGCVSAPEDVAKAIEADPSAFYVNVHNADYPAGAIRGQLMR